MQALETRQGLPFAIIVGNEPRLTIHLRDPDFKEAFYSTALISPAGLCESFPSSWVWPDVTCVVFTRLHRWDKASIENNLTALTEAAASVRAVKLFSIEALSHRWRRVKTTQVTSGHTHDDGNDSQSPAGEMSAVE